MKKVFIIVAVIVVLGVVGYVMSRSGGPADEAAPQHLLGDAVTIYVYTINGVATGGGTLSVPFIANTDKEWFVNVLADFNNDGTFNTDEWVARNQVARVFENYNNNFVLDLSDIALTEGQQVNTRMVLTNNRLEQTWDGVAPKNSAARDSQALVQTYEMADIIGINVPGASEDLKRGPLAAFFAPIPQTAYAQDSNINTFRQQPMPDIRQDGMECTPTATANNLISLAQEKGRRNDLPQNPQDIINELKRDMQFHNGVLLRNIISGKEAFAQRHNLPILTERIDNPTAQDIASAINRGCVVELSMAWVRSRSGHPNTGHVVSVAGVSTATGVNQIQVHDPATPSGVDTYDLSFEVQAGERKFEGVNYPMWDGVEFIDAIFVKCWTGVEHATTGTTPDTSRVEALVINGGYYPKSQFHAASPDRCNASHWHAGGTVYGLKTKTSTDIVNATDPNPTSCGFGKIGEVPEEFIDITFEQSTELIKNIPL